MRAFENRREAGLRLADALAAPEAPRLGAPVVLALPRGGVTVALEIARRLRAPLDLVMVRKLGVPWHPELAAGAVVNGDAPQRVVNPSVIASARLREDDLAAVEARELKELRRRREVYLGGRAPVPVEGRDAVVVDDGIATGATMRAAITGVRARAPRTVTLAVPVAPTDTLDALTAEVDRIVCLASPAGFYAIGAHYRDFAQVGDAEVVAMLKEADGFASGGPEPGA